MIAAYSSLTLDGSWRVSREDMAASVQRLPEDNTLTAVRRLLERHPVGRLGLAGGVFANVSLNRRLAEETGVEEV